MSAAMATQQRSARSRATLEAGRPAQRLFEPRAGGVSLEDSILRVWEDLVGDGSAGCPVCSGRLRAGVGCEACGSALD